MADRLRSNGAQRAVGQRSSPSSMMGGVAVAIAEKARVIAAGPRAAWAAFDRVAGDPGKEVEATQAVDAAIRQLVDAVNAWLSNVMSLSQAREAGAALQSELRPGLTRSRTGLAALERHTVDDPRLGFLAHLLLAFREPSQDYLMLTSDLERSREK